LWFNIIFYTCLVAVLGWWVDWWLHGLADRWASIKLNLLNIPSRSERSPPHRIAVRPVVGTTAAVATATPSIAHKNARRSARLSFRVKVYLVFTQILYYIYSFASNTMEYVKIIILFMAVVIPLIHSLPTQKTISELQGKQLEL